MEADVAAALTLLQSAGRAITSAAVNEMVTTTSTSIEVPQLVSPAVRLAEYDALLTEAAA